MTSDSGSLLSIIEGVAACEKNRFADFRLHIKSLNAPVSFRRVLRHHMTSPRTASIEVRIPPMTPPIMMGIAEEDLDAPDASGAPMGSAWASPVASGDVAGSEAELRRLLVLDLKGRTTRTLTDQARQHPVRSADCSSICKWNQQRIHRIENCSLGRRNAYWRRRRGLYSYHWFLILARWGADSHTIVTGTAAPSH